MRYWERILILVIILWAMFLMFSYKLQICPSGTFFFSRMSASGTNKGAGNDTQEYRYDRFMPLIFVGGVPRSGTTLMRAVLDAHPDVRCGQETRVIPQILKARNDWLDSDLFRLQEAGVDEEVLNSAIASFCLEVIARHGEPAPRLCNKDPLTFSVAVYLSKLFPRAKFIFMVTVEDFNLNSFRQCLGQWNINVERMSTQCQILGPQRCVTVHYEQLVLDPPSVLRKILHFLDLSWNENVLHHEDQINTPGGVSLSRMEVSSSQVIRPINVDSLSNWVGHIPGDVTADMSRIAPMMVRMGYDPNSNPPYYSSPDTFVLDNTGRAT